MLSTRRTPAMGWNSWNAFRCYEVNEEAVLANADALISLGLADAGYDTVVVDDGWQAATRDADGRLRSCPRRFPSGMKALGEQIHLKGLRFGMYLAPGRRTCAQYWDAYGLITRGGAALKPPRPVLALARTGRLPVRGSGPNRERDLGSWGREREDLAQLVDWEIDLLKYDWCRAECGTDLCAHEGPFALMSELIAEHDREIHFSISEYGDQDPWEWAPPISHSWRTTQDITRDPESMLSIARDTVKHAGVMGPGRVPDPDMLQVGNLPNATADRTHMLLWCVLGAPLMIGCDLRGRSYDDPAIAVMREHALVQIDQDPMVRAPQAVDLVEDMDCYVRRLTDQQAVVLVNPRRGARRLEVPKDIPGAGAVREISVDGRKVDPGTRRLRVPGYGAVLLRCDLAN